MDKRKRLVESVLCFFMVFSLAYIFGLVVKLDMPIFLQFLLVLFTSMFVRFIVYNPKHLYIFLGLPVFIIVFLNSFSPDTISSFIARFRLLIGNIIQNISGQGPILDSNILWFWGILLFLLSVFTAIIIYRKKNIFILLGVYLIFFLYYWYIHIDLAYWMLVLFLLAFFMLMTLREYKASVKLPSWLWTGLAYGVIILLLALGLPKSKNAINWPWLRDQLYTTFPQVEDWRSSTSYSRQYGESYYYNFSKGVGQGESAKLGGPLELSDSKLMTIYSNEPLYLRGNIKHIYNGSYWERDEGDTSNHRSNYDFSRLTSFAKRNYFQANTIKIKYHEFSSKTIFSPYMPSQIEFKDSSRFKVDEDYGISIEDGIYSGESYKVRFYEALPYSQLVDTNISYKREDIKDLDKYLQIPEGKISEATRKLTKDIVENIDGDLEKAEALESYLRENYEYSLDTDVVPEGQEFIDYFLFQEEKGYCTYYATTLAVMLRLENIPTRYIEGYIAKDLNEEGNYEVKRNNAHTWVEAFIEPVGWISFEPTPAYNTGPRLNDLVEDEATEDRIDDFVPIIPDEDIRKGQAEVIDKVDSENVNEELVEEESEKRKLGRLLRFQIFLNLVFLLVFLIFLYIFIKNIYRKIKRRKASTRKQFIYLYNDALKLMEVLGYPKKLGETPREYGDRLSTSFFYLQNSNLEEVINIFISRKYSKSPVLQSDLEKIKALKRSLRRIIRNNYGRRKFLSLYLKL